MDTIITGVHQVPGQANSFIVDGDDGVTLVDTGLPKRHGAIVDALGELGRSLDDVTAIVLTHAHVDHIGGAAALRQDSGAAVWAPATDAPAISGTAPLPIPPLMERFPLLRPLSRLLPSVDPVAVAHSVGEEIGGRLPADLRAIDTPGHTPGHTSYLLDRNGGVLFVGDAAVTRRGEVRRGWINRPEPVTDTSLRHLADLTFDIAVFGHAPPLRDGASAAFAAFAAALG